MIYSTSIYLLQSVNFQEVQISREPDKKLGMVIKGGLQGQPGNPHDPSDEGVFISKINEGGCIYNDYSESLKVN